MSENLCDDMNVELIFASINHLRTANKSPDAAAQLIAHLRICALCRERQQEIANSLTFVTRDARIYPQDGSKPWELTPAPPSPSSPSETTPL